jgi:diaminopimelate decarboxylase
MNFVYAAVTRQANFYGATDPLALLDEYGSPLYVYNERILRERCREMTQLVTYPHFRVNYSTKANDNLALLKIIRDEGLAVDAMSPGEIYVELRAGFTPEQILYIGNNVSDDELRFAIERGIRVSVDSVSQLARYGRLHPGGEVVVRFNPDVGAGHHAKVVTGGKKTKFGVERKYIQQVKAVLKDYDLRLVGVNQHIGSLFMEGAPYLEGVKSLLQIAEQFEDLEFVDFGGGFGIPYHKQAGQPRLDLRALGAGLDETLREWVGRYGKAITFKIEPGRYIAAECGVLLGRVYSVKTNYGVTYIGADLGFNVLKRPVMYDSHHDIEVYRPDATPSPTEEAVTIVGNICESGDIIAKARRLPQIFEGDALGVLDAGAYGFSMCSNYNNRLRPAEVLIAADGQPVLTRRRDTLDDLVRHFV